MPFYARIFIVTALFSFHRVIALDGLCPVDPCLNYLNTEFCDRFPDNGDALQEALEEVIRDAHNFCDDLDFSENAEKSVFDQMKGDKLGDGFTVAVLLSHIGVETQLARTIKENIPTNLNDCYEWSEKVGKIQARYVFSDYIQKKLFKFTAENDMLNTCTHCGFHDFPCLKNPGPNTNALLFADISFASEVEPINETCRDLRPTWCKNTKISKFNKLKKMCKKEGSAVRERYCCKTCESIAGEV